MKMKIIDFKFDHEAFGNALKSIQKADLADVAEVIGVDVSTLSNWQNGRWTRGIKHPSMSNFIKACNALDLDPRSFFVLDEPVEPDIGLEKSAPIDSVIDIIRNEWIAQFCRMCGKDYGVGSDGFCSQCRQVWNS